MERKLSKQSSYQQITATGAFTDLVEKATGVPISWYSWKVLDVPEGYQVSKIDDGKGNVVSYK